MTPIELSRRCAEYVSVAYGAAQIGVRLGVLDDERLQNLTDTHYLSARHRQATAHRYYNKSFNSSGLAGWERRAVDAYLGDCRSVVVGAAGGGREVVALSRRGMTVDAFECNSQLADTCRAFLTSQGVAAAVVVAAPNEVPESLGIYDGAIFGRGAYGHVVGRERRIALLTAFRAHLRPGGPLLLSFLVYRNLRSSRLTYHMANAIRMIRRSTPVEPGDFVTTTFDHRFTEAQIRDEFTAAGFDVVFHSDEPLGHAVATCSR